MIRHICMFTVKPENKEDIINAFIVRAQSLLGIETVKALTAVRNAPGTPENNYDVTLVIDFDSVEGLKYYQTHPVHVAFGKFITPNRIDRACIDYEFVE